MQLFDKYGHPCGRGETGPEYITISVIHESGAVVRAPSAAVTRAVDHNGVAVFEAQTLELKPAAFASALSAAASGSGFSAVSTKATLRIAADGIESDGDEDDDAASASASASASSASSKKKKSKKRRKSHRFVQEIPIEVYSNPRPIEVVVRRAVSVDRKSEAEPAAERLEGRAGTKLNLELVFRDALRREIPLRSLLDSDESLPAALRAAAVNAHSHVPSFLCLSVANCVRRAHWMAKSL